jgi:signal transduction histidine kinase
MQQAIQQKDYAEVASIATDLERNEEKIAYHGHRADAIVKSMLQHSRASAGEKQPTDINALAEEYLRLSYHGMRAKNKSFDAVVETHFDESLGQLEVVPQDIGRVLLNLFNNAFYAVAEKKRNLDGTYNPVVVVISRRVANGVSIVVKDNGTGMPQKVTEKVFQPFFTTKPTGEGTGLGLSLSYDIVIKGHGGEFAVQSEEGVGSVFTILLPSQSSKPTT